MSEDLNGKKERKKERGVSNGSKMVMQEQATSNNTQLTVPLVRIIPSTYHHINHL
jgi:hypothetical protein